MKKIGWDNSYFRTTSNRYNIIGSKDMMKIGAEKISPIYQARKWIQMQIWQ